MDFINNLSNDDILDGHYKIKNITKTNIIYDDIYSCGTFSNGIMYNIILKYSGKDLKQIKKIDINEFENIYKIHNNFVAQVVINDCNINYFNFLECNFQGHSLTIWKNNNKYLIIQSYLKKYFKKIKEYDEKEFENIINKLKYINKSIYTKKFCAYWKDITDIDIEYILRGKLINFKMNVKYLDL